MKLIIGLGNPGEKYEKSRHNVGFMVVDELLRKLAPVGKTKWKDAPNLKSLTCNLESEVILVKPQTMMNASGYAVKKLTKRYTLDASHLWVIHDDLDLPLGKIKIVKGRGSAGHYGVQSIIRELGSADFVRFRLGIGRPTKLDKWLVSGGKLVSENVMHREVERYVLEGFGGKEAVEAGKMIKKATKAIELAISQGVEKAASKFN